MIQVFVGKLVHQMSFHKSPDDIQARRMHDFRSDKYTVAPVVM